MPLTADGSPATEIRADGAPVAEWRADGDPKFSPIAPAERIAFHYDAETFRLDEGEAITTWENTAHSATSIAPDAHQPDASLRPTYTETGINGQPSAVFEGASTLPVGYFDSSLTQPYTIAAVAQPTAIEAGYLWGGADNAYRSILSFDFHSDFRFWAGHTPALRTPSTTDAHVFVCVADGAKSVLRVDTVEITGEAGSLRKDGLTIGARGDDRRKLVGQIGELRGFNHRLNATERATLVDELAEAWGLALGYAP